MSLRQTRHSELSQWAMWRRLRVAVQPTLAMGVWVAHWGARRGKVLATFQSIACEAKDVPAPLPSQKWSFTFGIVYQYIHNKNL